MLALLPKSAWKGSLPTAGGLLLAALLTDQFLHTFPNELQARVSCSVDAAGRTVYSAPRTRTEWMSPASPLAKTFPCLSQSSRGWLELQPLSSPGPGGTHSPGRGPWGAALAPLPFSHTGGLWLSRAVQSEHSVCLQPVRDKPQGQTIHLI